MAIWGYVSITGLLNLSFINAFNLQIISCLSDTHWPCLRMLEQ